MYENSNSHFSAPKVSNVSQINLTVNVETLNSCEVAEPHFCLISESDVVIPSWPLRSHGEGCLDRAEAQ